jgi:hypothetical protein
MDAQGTADAVTAMPDAATVAEGSEVTRSTAAEVDFTVVVAADSTVAAVDSTVAVVDSTAVVVGMVAADTGNRGLARSPASDETAGSERCQPFLLLRRRRFLLECAFSRILP